MTKAVVVCAKRYNGHELWTLLGTLQNNGVEFEVVSTEPIIRDELTLQPNQISTVLRDLTHYDIRHHSNSLIVVSGNMKDTEAYWTDKHLASLLKEARFAPLPIAAICCSVPTLSPIVCGIKVSYFPLVRSRHRLERAGAILQNTSLTVDQNTATAENQMLTEMWAEEIVNLIQRPGTPPLYNLSSSDFTPKGRERKMPREVRKVIDFARNKRDPNLPS